VTPHQNFVFVVPGTNSDQATTAILDAAYDRAIFGSLLSILRSWLLFAAVVTALCCVAKATCAQVVDSGTCGIEESAERNIEAGNKYLRYIITKYINDPSIDSKNQTLFAFAGYNAGPGGLHKFRDRAKAMGLNPNIWFGNVENAAAAIVGRETVQYVSNI
jgi:hypothetical protein